MLEYILRYNIEPFNWRLIFETNSQKVYTDVTKLMSPFSDFEGTKNELKFLLIQLSVFIHMRVFFQSIIREKTYSRCDRELRKTRFYHI